MTGRRTVLVLRAWGAAAVAVPVLLLFAVPACFTKSMDIWPYDDDGTFASRLCGWLDRHWLRAFPDDIF